MPGRFDCVKYDALSIERQQLYKKMVETIEASLAAVLPGSRYASLAITSLEEAYMWIGKAIRDEQTARGVQVEDVPARTNG